MGKQLLQLGAISSLRVLLLGVLLTGATASATAQRLYGIANPSSATPVLISFDAAAPTTLLSAVTISALGGQTLVGIETHPITGELYALGYTAASQRSQLYKLNPTTGVLTATNLTLTVNLGNNPARIGFAFSPTTGRVRLTGIGGQNYSVDPATVASFSVDGQLAFASTDANAGQTPSLCSLVYTTGPTGTLYSVDASTSRVVTIDPPTAGTLHTVAPLTGLGTAGVGQYLSLGFKQDTLASTATSYVVVASSSSTSTSTLYTLNLSTGVATAVGSVGSATANLLITDIAVATGTGVVTAARASQEATDMSLFPNPSSTSTSLQFTLSRAAQITLVVSDVCGRTVNIVPAGRLAAGAHTLPWNRVSQPAGLYFLRLQVDGQPAGTQAVTLTD